MIPSEVHGQQWIWGPQRCGAQTAGGGEVLAPAQPWPWFWTKQLEPPGHSLPVSLPGLHVQGTPSAQTTRPPLAGGLGGGPPVRRATVIHGPHSCRQPCLQATCFLGSSPKWWQNRSAGILHSSSYSKVMWFCFVFTGSRYYITREREKKADVYIVGFLWGFFQKKMERRGRWCGWRRSWKQPFCLSPSHRPARTAHHSLPSGTSMCPGVSLCS